MNPKAPNVPPEKVAKQDRYRKFVKAKLIRCGPVGNTISPLADMATVAPRRTKPPAAERPGGVTEVTLTQPIKLVNVAGVAPVTIPTFPSRSQSPGDSVIDTMSVLTPLVSDIALLSVRPMKTYSPTLPDVALLLVVVPGN